MRHLILREAGGMGDVVRAFPVLRALKRRDPGARVEFMCLAGYEDLVRLSGCVDVVYTVAEDERRARGESPSPSRHGYLRRIGAFDADVNVIDLYCPAYRHEVETRGAVTLDRVELFCRAAGVEPSQPIIELLPEDILRARERLLRDGFGTAEDAENAETARHGVTKTRRAVRPVPSPSAYSASSAVQSFAETPLLVGLAPYATHGSRSWLGRERLRELGGLLRAEGSRLVMFHSWKCPRPGRDEGSPADAGAFAALRLGWRDLATSIAACDVLIAADTGPLHIAGALGVPTLGLFGSTSGEVICRPYPTHKWMTATTPPSGCHAPCYGRPSRGYSFEVCSRLGCEALRGLTPGDVAQRLRLISVSRRQEPCALPPPQV
jgi:ADP-heptose:LPS heptosyltransferase